MKQHIADIRCDHDGLKMAEIKNGHLILRSKHHGETHVKIVALGELDRTAGAALDTNGQRRGDRNVGA